MQDVVAVATNLFVQARILAAAGAAGRTVRFVKSRAELGPEPHKLALVDLEADVDVLALITAVKEMGSGMVVAFGPHVDTAGRRAAKQAGADRVPAKSKFVKELPTLMAAPAAPRDGGRAGSSPD